MATVRASRKNNLIRKRTGTRSLKAGLARVERAFDNERYNIANPIGALMNTNWRSFLQSANGLFDGESAELLNFGDSAGELATAHQGTVVVPLCHLGLIEDWRMVRIQSHAQSIYQ